MLENIKTKVNDGRLWFGFPHYIVLGWAVLVSWTLFNTVNRLDTYITSVSTMAEALRELQEHTQELRDDSIRTRLILEMRFPREAHQVDEAFTPQGAPKE